MTKSRLIANWSAMLLLGWSLSSFALTSSSTAPTSDSQTGTDPIRPAVALHHAVVRHTIILKAAPAHPIHAHRIYAVADTRPSLAQLQGFRKDVATGPLALQSSVALVIDEATSGVLFSKHSDVALPIASITKLMTSLVVLEANQPMDEMVQITDEDLDTEKNTGSRLKVGTELSRRDLMHVALMSSENRAAHALCRSYPGGLSACLAAMNTKAIELGMLSAHFNDPTGLSSQNVASAEDLAKLLRAASANPTIREFSTDTGYTVYVGRRAVAYHTTNALVSSPGWDIVVQKTGYIVEAGKCLVMKAKIEGKAVLIVLLDSVGKYTRIGDANRIKKWMEANPNSAVESPELVRLAPPHVTS